MDAVETLVIRQGLDASAFTRGVGEMAAGHKTLQAEGSKTDATMVKVGGAVRNLGGAVERLAGQVDKPLGAFQAMEKRLDLLNRALDTGSISLDRHSALAQKVRATYDSQIAVLGRSTNLIAANTTATRLQAHQVQNLSYQLQDAAVQLAGGASPFLVLAQQGPQAAAAVGGVTAAFALLGGVIRAHPILTAAAVVVGVVSSYLLLRRGTEDATTAAIDHAAALEKANEQLKSSEERSTAAAKARQAEAESGLAASYGARLSELTAIEARIVESRRIVADLEAKIAGDDSPLGNPQVERALKLERDALIALESAAGTTRTEIDALSESMNRFAVATSAVAGDAADSHIKSYLKLFEDAPGIMAKAQTAAETYASEVARLNAMHQLGILDADTLARSIENLRGWLYQTSDAFAAMRTEVTKTAKAAIDLETALEAAHKPDVADDLKKRDAVMRALRSTTDDYTDAVRNLNSLQAKGLIGAEDYGRSIENLNAWLYESDPAFEKAAESAKKLEREWQRIEDRVTDFAADTIFDRLMGKAGDLWETFKQLGFRAIAEVGAKVLVTPAIGGGPLTSEGPFPKGAA